MHIIQSNVAGLLPRLDAYNGRLLNQSVPPKTSTLVLQILRRTSATARQQLDGSVGGTALIPSPSAHAHGEQIALPSTEQVAILLTTFNGAPFLSEQLDSLIAQTHQFWTIYASDDGSSDATLEILSTYQERLGPDRLVILEGPRQGFAANFLSLLRRKEIKEPYFAFCDQDDRWAPERLARGIQWMRTVPAEQPALFCSRTELIDTQGQSIGLSPLFARPPSFKNALVQSIAGGNTMLLNEAARQLLAATQASSRIVSHDWWAYILVSGCEGAVHYDPFPGLGYRQHAGNLMGSNASYRDRLVRLKKLFAGTFNEWNDANLEALTPLLDKLSPRNRMTLDLFTEGRKATLLKRLRLIYRSGAHRQTLQGNLGLVLATLFRRL